ncbi:unnamed protein product [Caenorhabditis brenneri]
MLILSIFTTDATCENRECGRFYSFFGRNSAPLWEKGRCNVSGPDCSCEPVRDPEAMYELARDEEDGTVFKMCFDPEDIPPNIIRDSLLSPCKSTSDCWHYPNAYCHGQELSLELYDELLDDVVDHAGFCQTDSPSLDPLPRGLAPFPDLDSYEGKLTVNGVNCRRHLECVGAGQQMDYVDFSVNYCNRNTSSGKGVCQLFQTSLNPCGDETTPIKPYVYCGITDSDCSGLGGYCGMGGVCCEMTAYIETPTCPIGEAYSKSCRDESDCEKERSYCFIEEGKSMGWCCQTETQSICPDTVTDHRREPRCDHSNISSCDNGICVHGRCCSTIKYDRATKLITDIPRKSFYTNSPCSMSMLNKQPMVRAFCDSETRKYVILGTEMDFSEHKTELAFSNRTCKVNKDCRGLNVVCARTFDTGICYHHPGRTRLPQNFSLRHACNFLWGCAVFWMFSTISVVILHKYETGRTYCSSFLYLKRIGGEKTFEEEWEEALRKEEEEEEARGMKK